MVVMWGLAKVVEVVVVVGVVGVGVVAVPHPLPTLPTSLDPNSCPPSYQQEHPLVLVSVDGFRPEYLSPELTPTLHALSRRGVRTPYMKPSYPTITFPNHYTLVTGLYPPVHGIVANKFYDPQFQATFRPGRPESFKGRWWGGEPIWKTAESQGKLAATFFWPGSEVEGLRPTYWYYYNESIPFTHRVRKVLSWLELPPENRPSFITLYMHEPDSTGHDFGPHSSQTAAKIAEVDGLIGLLVRGLKEMNLISCINLLVVSDHGMADAGEKRVINISDYIPNIANSTRFWDGAFARFEPNDGKLSTRYKMMEALSCKTPEMRVYTRETLPVRWHIGRQRRVEGVVVEVDEGYTIAGDDTFTPDQGEHGYDNYFHSMNALFIAHGPDLKRDYEIEAFHNTELYNLMCDLLKLTPAPNNGTSGALHHLLTSPPPPPYPQQTPFGVSTMMVKVPSDKEVERRGRNGNGCEMGDDGRWVDVLRSAEEIQNLPSTHKPWGITDTSPLTTRLLLTHHDRFTTYSPQLKLPRYISFNIINVRSKAKCDSGDVGCGSDYCDSWYSDVRLEDDQAPSCTPIPSTGHYNVSLQPLFPTVFSSDDLTYLPCLVSNAVPFSNQLRQRWQEMTELLIKWQRLFGPLNVVIGPVFDFDADSVADDFNTITDDGRTLVPTHIFVIVTRCVVGVSSPNLCPDNLLDTQAFVYPQHLPFTNCLEASRYAQEFSVRVVEVEKITGLRFYTSLRHKDRVRLRVRLHSNIWGRETFWDRLRNNFIEQT